MWKQVQLSILARSSGHQLHPVVATAVSDVAPLSLRKICAYIPNRGKTSLQ